MTLVESGELIAGRFRVDGPPLGESVSAVIWPAVDISSGESVAVRCYRRPLAAAELRALRERVAVVKELAHARLSVPQGLWSDGARHVLAEDRWPVPSVTVREAQPMNPRAVVTLGIQVCDALVDLHRRGWVHGDVRPARVVLGPSGAVLTGLAAPRTPGTGYPGQTAPEVLIGAEPLPGADLYGLGVVLSRALTGELPFEGPTPWAVLGRQQAGVADLPGPRGLAALIDVLLKPDPADRPPDAASVRAALRSLLRDPHQPPRWTGRWLAPIRPWGDWVVYGTDPATGAGSIFLAGVSRRRAARLGRRLRKRGWEVRLEREALGGLDLLAMLSLTVFCGLLVPLVGLPLGLLISWKLLSARCRPDLRGALPPCRTPLPPRELAAGTEHAAASGLLLLLSALVLLIWPPLVLIPGGLLGWLLWDMWNARRGAVVLDASVLRLRARVDEARQLLTTADLPLDTALGLAGELDAVDGELVAAEADIGDLRGRTDRVIRRVHQQRAARA